MKRQLLILFSAISLATQGQSIEPQVLATAGATYANGNTQLSWTLGEMAVATLSNGSNILTEGFHQPEVTVTGIGLIPLDDGIRVFPVPTASQLTIELPEGLLNSLAQVVDVEGKLVYSEKLKSQNNNLTLEGLSQGVYLLSLFHQDNNSTYRIQLIK